MSRLIPIVALAYLALASSAVAAPNVSVKSRNGLLADSAFTTSCPGESCRAVLRVFDGKRRVKLGELGNDYENCVADNDSNEDSCESDLCDPSYQDDCDEKSEKFIWSCRSTGTLRWTITMSGATDEVEVPSSPPFVDIKNVPSPSNGVTQGTIRVPKCGKVQPRRVRRGYVAASAAAEYEDEFVSRSVCSPLTALVRGKASTWRCAVTHNNTYRQCETIFRMRYTQQSQFGVIQREEHVKRQRTRCSSF